jgi:hypothetical protein
MCQLPLTVRWSSPKRLFALGAILGTLLAMWPATALFRPIPPPPSDNGRFSLYSVPTGSVYPGLYLIDSQTGAVWRRDGQKWNAIDIP